MPTMIDKVCPACGVTFTVTMEKKKQRTCKAAECVFKVRSIVSSERMKRRRNGGDPALNAKLAKGCGDHFRRMWQKPEFRAARIEESRQHISAYMADTERRLKRDENNRGIMGRASRRLKRDPAYLELMSAKVLEYRAQEPYRPAQHKNYIPDYVGMILHRVNTDEEVRRFCDKRMSVYLKEEQAKRRKLQSTDRHSP